MRLTILALAAALVAACSSSSSPTGPSQTTTTTTTTPTPTPPTPPTPTRFTLTGTVRSATPGVGVLAGAVVTITSGVNQGARTSTSAAGTYSLQALAAGPYTETATKPGYFDATGSGTLSANSVADGILTPIPLFVQQGVGDAAGDLPDYVTKLHITGAFSAPSANFIVWLGPHNVNCATTINPGCQLLVNVLLGTAWGMTRYDGTVLTGAGGTANLDTLSVIQSSGVIWTITEVATR